MIALFAIGVLVLSTFACGDELPANLDDQIRRVHPRVDSLYRTFHRHPEIAKQEFVTAARVRQELRAIGLSRFYAVEQLPTAVIAILETGRPGPVTCLRAELDAVSGVTDSTDLPYKTERSGLMHACGHDAHAAMLIGAADILYARKDDLTGRVVFLFQPAEEAPGGANELVNWGVIDSLGIDRMFALHSSPGLPVGEIQLARGAALAANTPFSLTVSGRGSHAATPHQGDDVLTAACEIVTGLAALPSRKLDVVRTPCIISISRFQYGSDSTTGGVLSPDVQMAGTIRSRIPSDSLTSSGLTIRQLVERYVQHSAEAFGVTADLSFKQGPPPTRNDPALAAQISARLAEVWPAGAFAEGVPSMTSEDFAYYTVHTPCLYFRLGIAQDSLGGEPLHTSRFTIHPAALDWGVRLLTELAFISSELP
ncbi:amidohydrolase [candidate division KSB1 bacterium]|nr:amidohydrolase [candidate division KSB1 bacterium]